MRHVLVLLCLAAAPAFAQTPNALVQFADPPESNGAPATTYYRHLLWNSDKSCPQRPVGSTWECLATGAEVAATYATQSSLATVSSSVAGNTSSISSLNTRVTTLESQMSTAQSAATAAQTVSSTNAAAITALDARVTAAEAAIAALQAVPKWACNNLSVASAITLPLGGLSSTSTVTVTGAPVGTYCGVGAPGFLPLGAEPLAAVTTTGSVSVRFQGSVGVIVPAGTYRVCCIL